MASVASAANFVPPPTWAGKSCTVRSPTSAAPERRLPYGVLVGIVAVLYFAREVLVPLALATLFSFLLGPVVRRLERCHFGRVSAVLTIAVLFFGLFGLVGWMVTTQVMDLASKLPGYQGNIQAKVESLRGHGSSLNTAAKVIESIEKKTAEATNEAAAEAKNAPAALPPEARPASPPDGSDRAPLAVRVIAPPVSPPQLMRNWLGPLIGPLAMGGLVVIFTVFMLLRREDLRDRLLHLAGPAHLPQTTQAVDDAGRRVGRYLLMQVAVNLTFGAAIAGGLLLIHVPNAALWGVLAAACRFVPYIGVWMSALAPLAISLAAFQSWWPVAETAALFAVLELTTGNAVEPWLYGSSTGLSPMAVMVAATFWTWLWGGVGLLLSMPLTVCIVVLGRYVPQLEFLHTLLGDEPVIPLEARLYQRLLAQDEEEAIQLVDEYLTAHPVGEFYDDVLVPTLNQAQLDARHGNVDDDHQQFIRQTVHTLLDDLRDRPPEALTPVMETAGEAKASGAGLAPGPKPPAQPLPPRVLIVPVKTEEDELAGMMFAHLLALGGVGSETLSAKSLANETLAAVTAKGVNVVCLSAVRPFAVMQARYLAKRLRTGFPDLKILVGLWGRQAGCHRLAPQPAKRARRLGGGHPGRGDRAGLPGGPLPALRSRRRRPRGENAGRGKNTAPCGCWGLNPLAVVVLSW